MSRKLVLLDGNSLFNRAFFALPALMNKKGFYTNAIYGFAMMTNNIIETQNPDYMAVAFDLKAPTFRHLEYSDYKAGRKKMPDELRMQIEPLKNMVDAMGIARAEFEGYEADDIIGTLSAYGEKEGMSVVIVTGDKDALQLASKNTKILITKKGITEVEEYDEEKVFEKYGLTPTEFIDLKALMGDKSDNIKGVSGIGEKTGIKLIQDYKSIEGIYEHLDEIKGSIKTKLENDEESAFLSKKLATIVRDIPIELDRDELLYKGYDVQKLSELYREFEFTSLLKKLVQNSNGYEQTQSNSEKSGQIAFEMQVEPKKSPIQNNFEETILIYDFDEKVFENTKKDIHIAIDYSKSMLNNEYKIHKVYIRMDEKIFVVVENDIKLLKNFLENEENRFSGYDMKNLYKAFLCYGIDIANLSFDIMIAEYVIDPNSTDFSIDAIFTKYGFVFTENIDDILGKGKSKIDSFLADQGKIDKYYKNILSAIEKIQSQMIEIIKSENLEFVFEKIEMKLIKVLADMEIEGFLVDRKLLEELSDEYTRQIADIEREIHDSAGEVFNINSPKQLGVILFEKLGLSPLKKTKTGYSTNIEVLEMLRDYHPIIEMIINYRQITKLKSTYIDGLSALIDPKNSKVHTTFSQTTASTGRLSSLDPNLQNIPIRTERGRKLRALFVVEDGYSLVDADYSQIELRILAHLSKDDGMIKAFEDNVDIHTKTASEVFGVPIEKVSSAERSAAKAVNFGIVYGISDFGLSNNLGISIPEAKKYISQYLDKYENVKRYLDDIVKEVEKEGYATTIFGRRRFVPEIKAKNVMVRNFGKRLAMNTPIQGAAADIIKLAMINVYYYLKENYADARLLLQVHDELIVKAKDDDAQKIKIEIEKIMENSADLLVRLEVETKVGKSWFDTK